ncbi:MAG TPA: transglutaminase-like domain-containing protein [Vicinamibacteria bacterium]|nr:transglutaminase-like domain-containing protein [Vicinamibacteria bacterium]
MSVSIVVLWASLMTIHLARSYGGRADRRHLDLSGPSSADAELTQRGIFYRAARIGFIRERFTPLDDGFRAEQTGELTLTLLGRERQVSIRGFAETGAGGRLREFQYGLTTASRRSLFETTVDGRIDGNELVLTITSGGSERSERRSLDEPIVLPLNLYYSLASRGWTAGETYRLRLFDPMTLSEGEVLVEVKEPEIVRWGGREEEAYRLTTTFAGLETTTWVNERGEILQEETPLGWTLIKEAPGSSLQARETGTAPDILIQSAVPAIGFAGDAAQAQVAELKLVNFPREFRAVPGGRQDKQGDVVRVTRERAPYRGTSTLSAEERAAALASDAFIQADAPAIRAQASALTEGRDEVEGARVLTQWVYDNIAKSPTLSIPSATEILEQRVGDCNEHTVLFTALARASGLPTRIATGLVYTSGQFYYHAWPEVFLGQWVAVDPTLGQFPADPMHLRLLTGGIENQYEVLGLLGHGVTIEVVEVQ